MENSDLPALNAMSGTLSMPEVFAFIQARSTSERLPEKTIIPLDSNGTAILDHIYRRLSLVMNADRVVFLVPENDEKIISFLSKRNYPFFTGDENDVRSRYRNAALHFGADWIIRLTGDNPILDIPHLELLIELLRMSSEFDIISFHSLPIGMAGEMFSRKALMEDTVPSLERHREHVTLHIKENPDRFRIMKLSPFIMKKDIARTADIRVTVDEEKDFRMVREVFERFPQNDSFGADELLQLSESEPEFFQINRDVSQVSFALPKPFSGPGKKTVHIHFGKPSQFGSGHRERCRILHSCLQVKGYELSLSDDWESLPESADLYIVDSRDVQLPEILLNRNVLILDGFQELKGKNHKVYYTLPHFSYPLQTVSERILFSSLLESSFNEKETEGRVLVYAGNIPEFQCRLLDRKLLEAGIFSEIVRIGGTAPELDSVKYFHRRTRFQFYSELKKSEFFLSYFGISFLEAVHLGKKIISYPLTDYHEMLTENISKEIHIHDFRNLNSRKFSEQNMKIFGTEGYEKLIREIGILLKG